ncbi:unnamed protein product [Allacma fusca]|uniref:Uncharacterized protein n=1 Tax=Allacma fusca TaxID=39272 RepID=A0A8J2JT48_9HEXA|nr:unnamed protein product [Allacma fusca]
MGNKFMAMQPSLNVNPMMALPYTNVWDMKFGCCRELKARAHEVSDLGDGWTDWCKSHLLLGKANQPLLGLNKA